MKSAVIQHNSWHTGTGMSEETRRVTDWRKDRRWEVIELKDRQQQEIKGKLQFHSHLTLIECTFPSLKVRNLKVAMYGTYCVSLRGAWRLGM